MAKRQYTEEEKAEYQAKREAAMQEMYNKIEEGVQNVFTSENYKKYLDTVSKFRRYSPNNTILIMLQNPEASLVAGYRKWEQLGRNVKKGEKAIYILSPNIKNKYEYKETVERDEYGRIVYNADGTERKTKVKVSTEQKYISGFSRVAVFDVSQTEGEPLADIVQILPETVTQEYADAVSAALDSLTKVKHETEKLGVGHNGYCQYEKNRIVLAEGLNSDMQIRTHVHEVAHYLLHGKDGNQKERTREQRELQAESVAYIISNRLGIDTSDYTFGYIAAWNGHDTSELKTILKDTQKATELIFNHVEAALKELNVRKRAEIEERAEKAHISWKEQGFGIDKLDRIALVESLEQSDCITYRGENFLVGEITPAPALISPKNNALVDDITYELWYSSGEKDGAINVFATNLVEEGFDIVYREKERQANVNDVHEPTDEEIRLSSREVIDVHNGEFLWVYFNPDGNDGKGQFVEMHVDENDLKEAFKARMTVEKAYIEDISLEAFVQTLYQNAHTELIDNDGSEGYEEYKAMMLSDDHDFSFESTIDNAVKNKVVKDFMTENSDLLQQLERNAAKDGMKPVSVNMAVTMWENGFRVLDADYNQIPSYDYTNGDNDYSWAENAKDYSFYVSHNDHYEQQMYDEIAECAEQIADCEDFALYDCYDEYDWNDYEDDRSIKENVEEKIRIGGEQTLFKYFYDVHKECFGYEAEIANAAEQGMQALKELHAEYSRRKEISEQNKHEADEVLDTIGVKVGRK